MEITKEVLQERLDGMTQQLGTLLDQVSQARGALNLCQALMEQLAIPEPEPEPASGMAKPDEGA